MKKIIYLILVITISYLANSISFETPVDGYNLNVQETSNISTFSDSKNDIDEISEKVQLNETKYTIKLNKLAKKRVLNITNDIYKSLISKANNIIFNAAEQKNQVVQVTTKSNSKIIINIY